MKVHISTDSEGNVNKEIRKDEETGANRWEERSDSRGSSLVSYQESPTALDVKIDMPGADARDLDVTITGRRLTVKVERRQEKRTVEEGRERVEATVEVHTKEVELPCDVDPQNVDAALKGGVLYVTLAKKGVQAEPVKVKIG